LLRKTLERLCDPNCLESYCHNIHLVRHDVAGTANNSPLYSLYSALRSTTAADPNWLDTHRSYFEDFIEMVVNDVTCIHLMLCTFLPSSVTPEGPSYPGWSTSLYSLRDEWKRRYTDAALAAKKGNSAALSDSYWRFCLAASEDAYFVTDFGDVGSETDVWNNCERILVQLFMQFIDLDSRLDPQTSSRGHGRRDAAEKQRQALDIVRKYTPPNVRAACLIRCQRWDEAVQVLDQANASLDACMLAVIHDIWGLSPRYEGKDGLSVGVGAYVIKAFLSPAFPLLPACYLGWQPHLPHASIYLFVTMALCLDSVVVNRLQVLYEVLESAGPTTKKFLVSGEGGKALTAGSKLTQQLIGWLLLHVFDDPETPRESKAARAHVIGHLLSPILDQIGFDSGVEGCSQGFDTQFLYEYFHEIWKICAGHLDSISRQNPVHLVETGDARLQSGQFDKWAECIMKALVFCVPAPSQCSPESTPFLVPPECLTQQRRAVLQAVTAHLTDLFSCPNGDYAALAASLDGYSQSYGSGSWFKCTVVGSEAGYCVEFANPKLQYIFQMLAVARAFRAHSDGFDAQRVLDIITGRPDVYNATSTCDDEDDGFNRVPDSSSGVFRDILLPVVGSTRDGVFTFTARDEFAACDGDDDGRDVVPDVLLWLLPPFDHVVSKPGRFQGQITRVPLHPAICRTGNPFIFSSQKGAVDARCRHQPAQQDCTSVAVRSGSPLFVGTRSCRRCEPCLQRCLRHSSLLTRAASPSPPVGFSRG
jgi:hypothetical protein